MKNLSRRMKRMLAILLVETIVAVNVISSYASDADGVMTFSEEEVSEMAAEASDSEESSGGETYTEESYSEDTYSEEAYSEDSASEDTYSEETYSEDSASEDTYTEDTTDDPMAVEPSLTNEDAAEDETEENLPNEDLIIEECICTEECDFEDPDHLNEECPVCAKVQDIENNEERKAYLEEHCEVVKKNLANATPVPTEIPEVTASPAATLEPTETPADEDEENVAATPSASVSPDASASASATPSAEADTSADPDESPSVSPSADASAFPSGSPSASPGESPSASPSVSPSATPSATPDTENVTVQLTGKATQKASRWIFSKKVNMSYTITVENTSEADATDVHVEAAIPSIITIDGETGWTISELKAGKSTQITFDGYINENTDNVDNLMGRFYINGKKIEDVSFDGEWRLVEADTTEGPTSISTVCEGVTINVSAADGSILPAGVEVRATRISSDSAVDLIEQTQGIEVLDAMAFDIVLVVNGEEVQPDGSVVVTFSDIPLNSEDCKVSVAHLGNGGVESVTTGSQDGVSIEASHFSTYVLYTIKTVTGQYVPSNGVTTADDEDMACFDFHIFTNDYSGSYNGHVNGNFAIKNVNGDTMATFGLNNGDKVSANQQVCYVENLTAWNENVKNYSHTTFVFGPNITLKVYNSNIYASQNGKDYLIGSYEQMKDVVYTSEKPYVDFAEEFRKATAYSEELSAKEKDTTVSITGDNNNKYISTASTEDEVYMTMRVDDFGAQMEFNACKEGQKFIINVVADGDTFVWNSNGVIYKVNGVSSAPGNSEAHAYYAGNILWNFVNPDGSPYEGTVKLTGTWLGTIMAPKATVDFTVVNGSVIADKVIKQDGESHKGTYTTTTANYTVHKSWEGGSSRPDVNIDLYRRVRNADSSFVASSIDRNNLSDTSAYEYVASATILCSKGETSYTFAKLPSSDEYGYSNEYFVVESATPGYEASYTGSLSIVNKFVEQEVGGLSLSKVNQNDAAVEGAVFGVYSDADATTKVGEMTTNAQGIASYGELIPGTYYVKEISAPAGYQLSDAVYTVEVVANEVTKVNGGTAVVNVQEVGALTLTKVDQDKNALAGVVFTVYTDETATAPVGTMTTDAQGKASYSDLAPGTYYVKETSVPAGYRLSDAVYKVEVTADTTAEVNGGAAIVNEKEKEYTDYSVVKTWSGSAKKSVTVQLMRDGVPATDVSDYQVTLGADSDQTYTWTNLLSKSGTEQYTYSVVEIDSKGNICANGTVNSDSYTVSYTNEAGKTTINNSYDSVNISGTKTWVDNDNQDGKRPSSITINLLANGEKVDSKTVSASDNWSYSFTDLPKYAAGKEITYTITEDSVENYTSEVKGYDVTNTHTPTTITVSGSKVWEDNNNQDGKRPTEIIVRLKADGKEVGNQIVKADSEGNWNFSFTDLPKYKNDNGTASEIIYTVTDEVKDYTATVSGSVDDGFVITNSYTPETTSISGTKTWDDQNNQDGKRPMEITIRLLANGKEVRNQTVSAAEDGTWTYSFTDLPKKANGKDIVYTITEDEVKEYTTTIRGYDVTNTHRPETTSIKVNKTWKDDNNRDGVRPGTITVQLIATVGDVSSVAQEREISVAADGSWSYTFTDLPVYRDGKEITYTVKETAVEGYTTTVSGSAANGFTITNTHITEKTSISGKKVWDDSNNRDGKRPGSIVVKLLENGTPVQQKTVTAKENWEFSFTDLPVYKDNGKPITYTVAEEKVEYYSTKITSDTAGFVITNSYTPETTNVSGAKTWNDADNQDGVRPESITINLLANGEKIDSKKVTEAEGWKWSFENLPKNENGQEITYRITEDAIGVAGYTSSVNGYNVTNSYTPETTEISGTKTWDDADNQDGKRPNSITINLFANGDKVQSQTVSAAEDGTWTYSFTDLPKKEKGEDILYTITEDAVTDYTTKVDGYNVTNSHTPETTEITVSKSWDDANNQDGKRPEKITINLLANGEKVDSKEVTATGNWSCTFVNLPVNKGGQEITYTVAEEAVDNYSSEITGNATAGFVITNSYTPETTNVSGIKTWNDSDNQDGKRPEKITINLLANGEKIDSKTVGEAEGWKWNFENLPKKENGKDIIYTITEDDIQVAGYTSNVDGYNVTNSYTPETIDISGNKTWDDNDNQDGKRPEEITVHLLANGTEVRNQTVSAAEGWKWNFTDLPKKEKGKDITYTITEDAVSGYTTEVEGYNVTNSHTPELTSIGGTKAWDDNDNQDGKRPEKITVRLLAGGVDTGKSVEVSEDNGWKFSFMELPKYKNGQEIIYTVSEDSVNDYTAEISDDVKTAIIIKNTHTPGKTSVSGGKTWNDENDQDGKRPEKITINLLANGEKVDSKTVTADNGWEWSFTDLPAYQKGQKITYTISEEAVTGYTPTINGYNVTNTHEPEKIDINGSKKWDDNNNQDGKRPTSITIKLLADGESTGKSVTIDGSEIDEEGNWKYSFTNLPKFKEKGKLISYTVQEVSVEGYETKTDALYHITNTHTPEKVTIRGTKVWDDKDNQDGVRPESIEVHLFADGKELKDKAKRVSVQDNWTWTFEDLDKYANGKLITYTVTEKPVEYYSTNVVLSELDESNIYYCTITNSYTPGKTSRTVNKVWEDKDNQDGIRPTEIKVVLLANGNKANVKDAEVTLNASNNWSYTWNGLDLKSKGSTIKYTVQEISKIEGYETSYTNKDGVITITNTHTPDEVYVEGTKTWKDANNQDGVRPAEIKINLLADGVLKESKIVSAEDNWNWKFDKLPKNKVDENGKSVMIQYSITEDAVTGYETTYPDKTFNVENTHTPEKTSISGFKKWEDNNNQDGKRPDSITVTLYADGVATNQTATVTAANNWQFSFTDLDKCANGKEIEYTVVETAVDGYTTTITGSMEKGYEITNSHEPAKINVSGEKIWVDADNQDGLRPDSIKVHLYANDNELTDKTATVTASTDGKWSFTFENLDKFINGKEVKYTVEEEIIDADAKEAYTSKITGDMVAGFTITNTHKPETIAISGSKTWNDENNKYLSRPESITVNLLADGEVKESKVITEADDWKYSFTNLPKYKYENGQGGVLITYTISEEKVEGYSTAYNAYDIANSYTPEKTSKTVTKIWKDGENQDGLRPDSITVVLLANSETAKAVGVADAEVTLNASNNWTYTWNDLPVEYNKKDVVYTVQEISKIAGYDTTYTNSGDTVTITNTHTPVLTEISGAKTWVDENNQDGARPEKITIRLYADGTEIQNKVVTANDNWSWSFTDLPKNKDGKEIVYTITEDAVDGYTTEVAGYNVTNTHTPALIDIGGTKTWNDDENKYLSRPEKIIVYLYADGEVVETKEVTDALGWTYSFKNLPKYAVGQQGHKIQYTIQEETVEGYSTTYEGYNITNSYTPEETSRTVTKLWDDGKDQDGLRPDGIKVVLLANGEKADALGVTDAEVTLDASNDWTYTWTKLPVKYNKKDITYTVQEISEIEGYETTYSEDTFIITNTHTPAEVYVEGVKTWEDGDDQDGLRPDSITVVLLADGVEYTRKDVTPAADGTWSWKFEKLPKNKNVDGTVTEIQYSIEEIKVEGYESKTDYTDGKFNLINTHKPETVELSGSKTWNDANDQDGVRPSSITIHLLADGVEVDSRTVTAADNWSWTFKDLPKNKNVDGTVSAIGYTITEDAVDGYTASYTDDGTGLINSYTPEKTGRNVVKIWDDGNNADRIRPAYIEVQLYADGEAYGDAVVLNDANGWSHAWTDLQAKKGGQYIVYTVQEITNVSGYTTTVTESGTTFTIVNYHPVTPPPTPTPPTTPPSTPPEETPTPTTPNITPTPNTPTPTPDDNEVLGARRGGAVLGARRGLDQAVLGKRRRPTTGDSAALIIWMITLFGAMGAATVSVIGLRKKEEEK